MTCSRHFSINPMFIRQHTDQNALFYTSLTQYISLDVSTQKQQEHSLHKMQAENTGGKRSCVLSAVCHKIRIKIKRYSVRNDVSNELLLVFIKRTKWNESSSSQTSMWMCRLDPSQPCTGLEETRWSPMISRFLIRKFEVSVCGAPEYSDRWIETLNKTLNSSPVTYHWG